MISTQPVDALSCRFGPLEIRYDARVLTPRSWTLLQSRWAADLAAEAPAGPILELCAGAGHIGLVAAALTGRSLVQVEADGVAADYARANAERAGLGDRVEVRTGRLETSLRADERFPVMLADPPYLRSSDVPRWPDDPRSAIDGGDDGMQVLRACLDVAGAHLAGGGVLLLQVAGRSQADAVTGHLATSGLSLAARDTRHHDDERAVMLLVPC